MTRAPKSSVIKIVGTVLALLVLTAAGPSGIATGQAGMSAGESFQIGGSCAGLAYLNKDQIATVLAAAFSDDMHSFCYPEEPSECSDYSAFLQGSGRLTTGDDHYHCALSQ